MPALPRSCALLCVLPDAIDAESPCPQLCRTASRGAPAMSDRFDLEVVDQFGRKMLKNTFWNSEFARFDVVSPRLEIQDGTQVFTTQILLLQVQFYLLYFDPGTTTPTAPPISVSTACRTHLLLDAKAEAR